MTTRLQGVLGALFVVIVAGAYLYFKPEPAPTGVHIEAKVAREVAKVPKVEVVIAVPLKVYAPKAKQKLKLPEHIQKVPEQHVVASVKTPNDERQHTFTTLVDTRTGEFTTLDRVDPQPWLAVSAKTQVGAYIGLKNGVGALRLQVQQDALQIKAIRLGATASVDLRQDGQVDSFIGIGGVWRF